VIKALVLITTLESRIPSALVWKALVKGGMTLEKLQKSMKKKSLYLIGKAEMSRKLYADAVSSFEQSLSLISGDTSDAYMKEIKELKDLIAGAQKEIAAEKKKEKSTWKKAFSKSKKEYAEADQQATAESASSSPSSPNTHHQPQYAGSKNANASTPLDVSKLKVDTDFLSDTKKSKRNSTALWNPPPLSSHVVLLGLGVMGLLGGVAFWWTRLRRQR
jgi:hypothetical protein